MEVAAKSRTITLDECVSIAVQNHPDLKIQDEKYSLSISNYKFFKAQRSIQVAASILTKEFNLDASSDTTIAGKDTDVGIQLGINANYSIYDRKKEKREKLARVQMNIAKIDKKRARDDLVLKVKQSYYNYLMAREATVLNKQLYLNNLQKLKLAQKLFKRGQRPILDVSKAEISYAEAHLDYEKAKNKLRSARIMLFISMGIQDSGADIIPIGHESMPFMKFTYDELKKLAYLYNNDLQSISINKMINKIKIDIARADRYPKITLDVLFGYENQSLYRNDSFEGIVDSENWELKIAPSIKFTLPLYSGGAISANVNSSINEYNIATYKERQVKLMLENNILDDVKMLEELAKQIEMSELIIENSKKHLLLANKSYESGVGTLLELQDAQARVIKAEIGYLNSKYQYFLTIAQLSNRIGLEEDYLCIKK